MNLTDWKNRRAQAFPSLGRDLDIWEIMQLSAADLPHLAVIDTETTGLDAVRDEILELTIMTPHEGRSVTWRFRPTRVREWPEAERVNGIAPEDVQGCRTIDECMPEILGNLCRCSAIIGYNVDFDLRFLLKSGVKVPLRPTFDVMREAREMLTTPREDGSLPWISLVRACEKCGVEFMGPAHDSYFDCLATWQLMVRLHQINMDILPFRIRDDLTEVYEQAARAHEYHGLQPWELKEVLGL